MNDHTSRFVSATAVAASTRKPSNVRRRHKHLPGDEALCKYASKACYIPRVVKKTGELHRYCEHHRVQANRNQQRLEQRRRVKTRSVQAKQRKAAASRSMSCCSDDGSQSSSSSGSSETPPPPPPPSHGGYFWVHQVLSSAMFEPFQRPVPLRDEDLSNLCSIFNDPSSQGGQTFEF